MELLPCPCGEGCSLSYCSPTGGLWRVVAYPCGTEGPARGHGTVITVGEATRAWNEWVAGVNVMRKGYTP